MSSATGTDATPSSAAPPARRVVLLRVLVVLAIVSTAVHYAHNYAAAEMYPPVPPFFPDAQAYRIGIVVFWPLLTALLLVGYGLYRRGRVAGARAALIVSSLAGLTTPLHFLGGVPHVPAFFMITIFTDFLTGLAILVFALTIKPAPVARTGTPAA